MTDHELILQLQQMVNQINNVIAQIQQGMATKQMVNELDLLREQQIADLTSRVETLETAVDTLLNAAP
jgi:polyhydroxyalkanoate synthesis regulator phasin